MFDGAVQAKKSKQGLFDESLAKLNAIDFGKVSSYLQRTDKNAWSEEQATAELENFKAFFALRSVADFSIVPTKAVDEVWHAAILHTFFYGNLCEEVFGRFVHHYPSDGTTEMQQRNKTSKLETAALFLEMTGRQYCGEQELNEARTDCNSSGTCNCCIW